MQEQSTIYETTIRLIILLLIIVCSLMIMAPFVNIIMWTLILGIALSPIHSFLSKSLGNKPKLASFLIVSSTLIIIIIPIGLMVSSLVDEIKVLKTSYDSGTLTIPSPDIKVKEWPIIGEKVYTNWLNLTTNRAEVVSKYQNEIVSIGGTVLRGMLSAVSGLAQIAISLILAGVFLGIEDSGESIRKFFRKLGGERGDEYADLTKKTINSVVKGIIGEGFVLALLHGLVFMLAGVPYAGIWTLLVFVFAIMQLPVFAVTIPVMIYFFNVHETVPAILWSIFLLLATLSDNVLTPLMLGKGAPVPMVVMFIGVLGGFVLFGFIGLFTGAVVLALGYNLLVSWTNSGDTVK